MREEINYRLGLDIGITSVGWSVINLDKQRIEDLGVRIFNAAENPKDGSSLAMPRRLARGRRRLIRRKAYRVRRVKSLIIENNILSKDQLDNLFTSKDVIGVWEARTAALDRMLTNSEFAKILITLSKRRGFKSNRKNEVKDKETGQLLNNIQKNKKLLEDLNYRTVGEFIYKEVQKSDDQYKPYRNKEGQYDMCVSRDMIREEIHLIFESQRKYDNAIASDLLEDKYLEIFNSQRPYSSLEELEKMVGYCTFEKKKCKRAPKHSLSAEEFGLYDSINKISIVSNGDKRRLTSDEREVIIDEAFRKKEIKYTALRKLLGLKDQELFSTLTYSIDKDISKTENTRFVAMLGYHEIKKSVEKGVSKEYWDKTKGNRKLLNDIAYVLTLAKTDEEIEKHLKKIGVDDIAIESLQDISFTKFNNLSIVALDKIIPFMKEGVQYNQACEEAGYDFKAIYQGVKSKKLPLIEIDEIVNPVVVRALSQTRKVINAIIDKYGSPAGINIELARDLAKNKNDRNNIKKEQDENKENREKIKDELKSLFGKVPTGSEIIKYRLWEQQRGECAYTQTRIPLDNLFNPGAYEIDHVIPFSRTFDDSLSNKVLVLGRENQRKGNRTPYEYFGYDEERWHKYEVWVNGSKLGYKKRNSLLKKKFSKEEVDEWKQRNLVDTRYITKYIANYIANRLEFRESETKRKVLTVNGRATAYLRAKWGLYKVRDNGDKHHALDATVVAVVTQGLVNKISSYSKAKELQCISSTDELVDIETGEIVQLNEYRELLKEELPRPWIGFTQELEMRLTDKPLELLVKSPIESYDNEFIQKTVRPIFVSRVPFRKIGGKFFGETVYSKIGFKDFEVITEKKVKSKNKEEIKKKVEVKKQFIVKKKLVDLKEDDLKNFYNYQCDKKLYDEIIDRMVEFNYNAKKAFEMEFRKPTKDGSPGPLVKSVKVVNKVPFNDGVDLNKGKVAKEGMVRIDIYQKESKYFTVPVYRYQLANGEIPNKAATRNKAEIDWEVMSDSYLFKFSVFKNDLIKISYKNREDIFGYYDGFNRNTVSLAVELHDGSNRIEGIGVKTDVKEFVKYEVDVLGKYYRVTKEGK